MKVIWLSSPTATFCVDVNDDDIIIKAAPICWRWVGRRLTDLMYHFNIDKVTEIVE